MSVAVVALVVGIPALAFALWPIVRRHDRGTFLPLPPDAREQLLERKRQIFHGLRELDFEYEAGHVSDDDYADLKARSESEAAAALTELDRLGASVEPPPKARLQVAAPAPPRRSAWRHPLAVGASAVLLVVFGIAIGSGIVRYTEPDPTAGTPMPGSRPLAPIEPALPPAGGPGGGSGPRTVTPEIMQGMLQAARTSLFAGRYSEAISAYQAVLKRDPKNVDAMTHLALIVAIGGHADSALETFERALAIDPNYPPALLYRGQVLYDAKRDVPGAIRSWETFLTVAPPGEERERVKKLIAEARTKK